VSVPPIRILLLAAAALACGSPTLLPDRSADIAGVVTNIQPADTPERPSAVRIEANPAEESGSPKMVLVVTRETRVLDRSSGDEPRAIERDDLRVGDRVEAWVTGPVQESYPSRATAETIVVLGDPAP
jgi:hypothetical protein